MAALAAFTTSCWRGWPYDDSRRHGQHRDRLGPGGRIAAIVYLHGFLSSPASVKAARLREYIAGLPPLRRPALHVPALPHRPAAAVGEVAAWVASHARDHAVTLVGSSLGGYYATYLAERLGTRAALINPAVRPYASLEPWRGPQTNLYTGETFEVTQAHFDELRALAVARITRPARYFLLVETGDEVLDYREALAHYAGAFQYVQGGGNHTFTQFVPQIPAILRFAGVEVGS